MKVASDVYTHNMMRSIYPVVAVKGSSPEIGNRHSLVDDRFAYSIWNIYMRAKNIKPNPSYNTHFILICTNEGWQVTISAFGILEIFSLRVDSSSPMLLIFLLRRRQTGGWREPTCGVGVQLLE